MYKITSLTPVVVLILLFASSALAGNLTADEILDKAENTMDLGSYEGTATMTIYTSGGDKRILEMEFWAQGTNKMLIRYARPARIEGTSFLFLEDEIWSYFPRTGRTRRLASHIKNQKMMGSSFSYDDFSSDFFSDYTATLVKTEDLKGKKCYVLEGRPDKGVDSQYSRILVWVDTSDYRLHQAEYFQSQDKVKKMNVESFMELEGKPTPKKIVMHDILEDTQTTFEYNQITTGVEFSAGFFSQNNLPRVSDR